VVARRLKEVLENGRKTAHMRPRRTETEIAAAFGMDNPIDEWHPQGDGLVSQTGGSE
jgi:hypothetical protein